MIIDQTGPNVENQKHPMGKSLSCGLLGIIQEMVMEHSKRYVYWNDQNDILRTSFVSRVRILWNKMRSSLTQSKSS